MAITKENVQDFLKTDEGKVLEKELVNNFIENSEEGKALLDQIMAPELDKSRMEAIKQWETAGGGKGLKAKNTELLEQIAGLKEKAKNSDKLQELLDLSGLESYNVLEETVLSLKANDGNRDEELIALKKAANDARREARELKGKFESVEKERDEFKNATEGSNSYIAKFLIDNEIKNALLKQGFDVLQAKGLVSHISNLGKFTVDIDEASGDRRAVNELGITPEDFTVKEWWTSDEGKAFKPNKAGGGGASGGTHIGMGVKPKSLKEMSWSDRMKMQQEDPEAYAKLKAVSNTQ